MGKLKIEQRVIGMVATNVYLGINMETKEAFLVDPADRAEDIAQWIRQDGVTLKAILLTHGHFDHIGAVAGLKKEFQVPVYAMGAETVVMEDSTLNLSANWASAFTVKCDHELTDEEKFQVAGFDIVAYHTPGHTKGGACYYIEEEQVLFSGDTIFCHSVGRTDLPTGSMGELRRSVQRMLQILPDATRVMPGHECDTSVADEKRYNPYS